VAVVIPLKLVYAPVDDNVTAPLCSTSTSTSRTTGQLSGSIFPAAFVVRWKNAFPHW